MPFVLIGFGCIVIDQWMNIEFILKAEKAITSLVFAVPVSGIAAVTLFPAMAKAWRLRQPIVIVMATAAWAALAVFSLGASLDRAGSSLDAKVTETKTDNMAYTLAQSDLKTAQADLSIASDYEAKERGTGCGPKCRAWKAKADDARVRVSDAKRRMLEAGAPKVENSMGVRVASLFPGITENAVSTYYPIALPFGIWLAGLVFTGIGFAPNRIKPTRITVENLPLGQQIRIWMDHEQERNGLRPTQTNAAKHFGVHKSTVSRHLKSVS